MKLLVKASYNKKGDNFMPCLQKYRWVKLARTCDIPRKGILGAWARLAMHAAFRYGVVVSSGQSDVIRPGYWIGKMAELMRILDCRWGSVLPTLEKLSECGYIDYAWDHNTKRFSYSMKDWVSVGEVGQNSTGRFYATNRYGFLCIPRTLAARLVDRKVVFGEADAWIDLWCHTVWRDSRNVFSMLAPVIQYGYDAALTLETLGGRGGWEKTKVWRFFRKYRDTFALSRLPGSYGCLIWNRLYPTDRMICVPTDAEISECIRGLYRFPLRKNQNESDRDYLNRLVRLYGHRLSISAGNCARENRVALFAVSIRADLSLCEYDCGSIRNRSYQNQGGRYEGNRGEGTGGTGEGFAVSDREWGLRGGAKVTGHTATAEGEVLPQHAAAFAALPQHCLDVGVLSGADRAGGGLPVRAIGYTDRSARCGNGVWE